MAKAKAVDYDMTPTDLKHVYTKDINDDGILEEIAVVKKWEDGSISYIDISTLGKIDKARLKSIVESKHADKYELWELMAEHKLSNGLNALDFFHNNMVKVNRAKGTARTNLGGGLKHAGTVQTDMPGSEFSDPHSASVGEGGGSTIL